METKINKVKLIVNETLLSDYVEFALDSLYKEYKVSIDNSNSKSYLLYHILTRIKRKESTILILDFVDSSVKEISICENMAGINGFPEYSIDAIFTDKIHKLIKEYEENNSDIQRSVL